MAMGSAQPPSEMNTRNIPRGKGGRYVRLTTYHHTVPLSRNIGALTLLDPSGPAWPVTGVLYLYHPVTSDPKGSRGVTVLSNFDKNFIQQGVKLLKLLLLNYRKTDEKGISCHYAGVN